MEEFKIELLKEIDPTASRQIAGLVEQLNPGSPTVTIEHVEKVIGSPTAWVFVVRDEQNIIVGMATLVVIMKLQGKKKALIEDVVVDEAARGRGLGKQLIERILEEARKLKVKTIFLTSRPTRTAANQMYQKMGFVKYKTNNYKFDLESF